MKRNKTITLIVLLSLFAYLNESEKLITRQVETVWNALPDSLQAYNHSPLPFLKANLSKTNLFSANPLSLNN